MKLGIISDIHSNVIALRECMVYMERAGCEEFLFLGDYISDTPYVRETMDYLYELNSIHKCRMLRGNREEYMLSQRQALREEREKDIWLKNSASGNLFYTYERLTEKDLDFFDTLPMEFVYEKEGYPSITCCHGSPENSRELLQIQGENTKRWLEKIDTDYLICAHTHIQGAFSLCDKYYFNPGSTGIAIGTPGMAQCMLLEDTAVDGVIGWRAEFLKIPYDRDRVIKDMFCSGLIDMAPWFINSNIQILLTGEDNSWRLVEKAGELSKSAGEKNVWPHLKEKYFSAAAKDIGIPDYRNKMRNVFIT